MTMARAVAFFDVDYTLIKAPPQHRAVLARVFTELFGVEFGPDDFRGRVEPGFTDLELFRRALEGKGLDGSTASRRLGEISDLVAKGLRSALSSEGVEVLPGVRGLLPSLLGMGLELALFTGNVEKAAWVKLEVAGLGRFFSWGVFGEEGETKMDLARLARERASLRHGSSSLPLFLVGDARRDVLAGKAMGAAVVGVYTGPSSAEDLLEAGADLVVPDLADLDLLLGFFRRGLGA